MLQSAKDFIAEIAEDDLIFEEGIRDLAAWCWKSTHEGEEMTEKHLDLMEATLLGACDKHEDGCIHSELFLEYYDGLAAAVLRHKTDDKKTNKTVQKLMEIGKEKFKELDLDVSGYLKGDEVMAMTEWVWKTFNRHETLTPAKKLEEAAKILKRCDLDEDGTIDFDEFMNWFCETAVAMAKFQQSVAIQRKQKKTKDESQGDLLIKEKMEASWSEAGGAPLDLGIAVQKETIQQ